MVHKTIMHSRAEHPNLWSNLQAELLHSKLINCCYIKKIFPLKYLDDRRVPP